MKIVVGSIQQEVNTFSPLKPKREDFFLLTGEEMLGQIAVAPLFAEHGVQMIPTLYANAVPSGRMAKDDYIALCRELIDRIPADGGFDGIWLYCHGAMDVEEIGSGEVYLLKEIRDKVGYEIPIALALDFHANNDFRLFSYANVVCGYRTAPHRDMPQTQIRAGQALLRCISEGLLPEPAAVRVPLIVAGDMVITDQYPMNEIMALAVQAERDPEILSANVFHGQNWADVKNAGASVVVTAARDKNRAFNVCRAIAEKYWSLKEAFRFQIPALPPREALENAAAFYREQKPASPVFLSDSGDNTTAGAAGDRTDMFSLFLKSEELLASLDKPALLGGIADREALLLLWKKKPGDSVSVELGGKLDKTGRPLRVAVTLKRKGNILNWDGDGADAGRAAVVSAGPFDAVITENRCALISPEIFASVGVELSRYALVCVKLGYLYPKLAEAASHAVLAKTEGGSTVVIESLDFKTLNLQDFYPFGGDVRLKL